MNVWAIWNPDGNGNPQVVPAFSGYGISSTGYPAHLFQEFMAQALQGMAVEQFPTAKDNGKIGGPDGTWGLARGQSGVQPYANNQSNANRQSTEDAQKQAEQDAQRKAEQDAQRKAAEEKAEQEQEFARQCLANPSYSTNCPNYPGATQNRTDTDNKNNEGTTPQ